jgi:hypothetical protein
VGTLHSIKENIKEFHLMLSGLVGGTAAAPAIEWTSPKWFFLFWKNF